MKTHKELTNFGYKHLPAHLQSTSKPFHDLAKRIVETTPDNREREFSLRKLLESKDCAVRALLEEPVENVVEDVVTKVDVDVAPLADASVAFDVSDDNGSDDKSGKSSKSDSVKTSVSKSKS